MLPGGRIRVPWPRWPHTLMAAAWYLGPAAWRVQRRLRRDPIGGRFYERRLARRVRDHLGVRLRVEGTVPGGGPFVVLSLHEGFADALALLHLPLDLWFAARDELFTDWPWLGRHLRAHGAAEVPTEHPAAGYRRLLRQAPAAVEHGLSPAIFAQGSILGVEVALQEGAFRLARRLRLPLLPVAITGSHRVWEWPYSPTLRYGQRVTMKILDPIEARDDSAALAREVGRLLREAAFSEGMEPPRRFDPGRDGYWDGYTYEIDAAYPELARRVREHRELLRPADTH